MRRAGRDAVLASFSSREIHGADRTAVEAAIAADDWAGAVTVLRRLLQIRPHDAAAARDLVWVLGRSGREAEASAFLTARPWLYRTGSRGVGVVPGPDSVRRDSVGSDAAGRGGAGEPKSIAAARAATRRRPEDAAAHAALAEALVGHARAQTASMGARCLICHHREPPLSGDALTRVLLPERELLQEALAARRAALRLRASAEDALGLGQTAFYLATLYPPRHHEASQTMAEAHRLLERAVRTGPRSADAWSSLALARLKRGDASGAASAWRRALILDPDREAAWVNLANLLPLLGREAEAVRLYAEGMRRLPRSAALRTNYGVVLWQAGRYREAIAMHRGALRRQPGEPIALLNLGLALKATGDLEGAEAALRESIRRRPGGAVAHNALGSLLAQRGDWEAAARAFAEATRHSPGLAAAHANLGRACERLGRWSEVAVAYRRALLWEPERTLHWQRVAEAHARAGEYDRATEAAGRFLAAHPDNTQAQELRRRLAAWRDSSPSLRRSKPDR
jgi:tetratricopeptide (TPR) repeat protein